MYLFLHLMFQLSVATKEIVPPPSASNVSPPLIKPLGADTPAGLTLMQHKPPIRTQEPPHNTVFEKAIERLATMFPDYTR